MAANQYLPWEPEDIDILEDLLQRGYNKEQIARCLERTPRAVQHAMRHLLTQHSVEHGVEATMKRFQWNEEELRETVAPTKYAPVKYTHRSSWDMCCPMTTILMVFTLWGMLVMYGGGLNL